MQRFRKLLTALLVAVTAWAAAVQPGAAFAPSRNGGADPAVMSSCNAPCDDCWGDCDAAAACPASCVRLPAQPMAWLDAPPVRLTGSAGAVGQAKASTDFASRAIRPLLPPPRG